MARMRVEEKTRRQIRSTQTPCGFAVARGREVQQREPLECDRVVHVRVERRDKHFGDVKLVGGDPLVGRKSGRPLWTIGGTL